MARASTDPVQIGSTVYDTVLERGIYRVGTRRPAVQWDDYGHSDAQMVAQGFVGTESGAHSDGAEAGGVYVLTTGTSASSTATYKRGAVIGNALTTKWFWAARFKVSTAIDGNAKVLWGIQAAASSITMGVLGSSSTAVFGLQYNGTLATGFASLGVPIDTAYHHWEMWSDGAGKITAHLDDGAGNFYAPITVTQTVAMASGALIGHLINGATAAARTSAIDWSMIVAQR